MITAGVFTLSLLVHLQAPASPDRGRARSETSVQASLTILFFTSSWCEPCRAVGPILEKYVHKNGKRVKLVEVDFDRAKSETARWKVQEIPVVIVLSPQGKVMLRSDGADQQTLSALEPALEKLLRNLEEEKR